MSTDLSRALPPEQRGGVAAVDRAFAVLAAFGPHDRSLTLAELGRRTGLYKSTILRLIESIERAGFIRRLDDGGYAVGASALNLGRLYQRSFALDQHLLPALQQLSRETGETASFFVRDRDRRVCLRRVEPERSLRIVLSEGDRLPLEQGSAGKILLAFGAAPPRALAAVRGAHFAVSRGERDRDAASVSAPVFAGGGRLVGALSISGPIDRFVEAKTRELALLLLARAAALTRELGGDAGSLADARRHLSSR
jgi:DNA-binding IclR family transcriptional regulator